MTEPRRTSTWVMMRFIDIRLSRVCNFSDRAGIRPGDLQGAQHDLGGTIQVIPHITVSSAASAWLRGAWVPDCWWRLAEPSATSNS